MKINFDTVNFQNNNQHANNIYLCPSFKMKMSELKGIDQYVAKRYNINPQQKSIKTLKDFQDKCKSLVEEIFSRNY